MGFSGVSEDLGFIPTCLKWVELRESDFSLQGPLVHGHPSAKAGSGGLGLPCDPAGVPWTAEFHRACQAQGEATESLKYRREPSHSKRWGWAGLTEWDQRAYLESGSCPEVLLPASEDSSAQLQKAQGSSSSYLGDVRPF